jgi:hypothetical protein
MEMYGVIENLQQTIQQLESEAIALPFLLHQRTYYFNQLVTNQKKR